MERVNDVVCAGILVADHVCTPMRAMPEGGQLVAVDAMFLLTGGCAANVAVNVAKQGLLVGVVGRVGADIWGRFISEDLTARGVDIHQLRVSECEQTSQSMVLLCAGQDRRFVHTFGANRELRAADVTPESLAGARILYVGGYLAMPGMDPDGLAALFRRCRERDMQTVLDVVIPTGCRPAGELDAVLPYTDVFLPNNDEAAMLTGEEAPERQAAALLARGAGTVVITQGDGGLYFAQESRSGRARHFPSTVVDQTGAGDAFCAGFITGMVRGLDLPGCIRYGSALGASCVRSIGCYEGVLDRRQAAAFLAENPLEITGEA